MLAKDYIVDEGLKKEAFALIDKDEEAKEAFERRKRDYVNVLPTDPNRPPDQNG